MKYSLQKAATATGKAKSTIHKALKDGLISAEKDDRGRYKIDPSELHRVFPPLSDKTSEGHPIRTESNAQKTLEMRALEAALEAKQELIEQVKSERDKIYGLITNQSEQASREVETLRARIEQAEAEKDRMKKAAQQWKAQAEAEKQKPWYKKLFG